MPEDVKHVWMYEVYVWRYVLSKRDIKKNKVKKVRERLLTEDHVTSRINTRKWDDQSAVCRMLKKPWAKRIAAKRKIKKTADEEEPEEKQ